MKYLLTVIIIILSFLSLFSQNPIVREEYFEQYNNQWEKVSIVERAFDNQGIMTNEKRLYFDNSLNKWIPQKDMWFDQAGNEIRTIRHFFINNDLGFFKEDIQRTFNESNQVLEEKFFIRENKNSDFVLNQRIETSYFDDCSYLQKMYFRDPMSENKLVFSNQTLFIFDKDCRNAATVFSPREDKPIDRMKNEVRITYSNLSNGHENRVVERMICADTFGCDDWEVVNNQTYTTEGKLVMEINGSTNDFFRQITTVEYATDKITYTYENFRRTNEQPNQTLFSRFVTIVDTAGNTLFRKRFEPFYFDELRNIYDKNGLIQQMLFESTRKDSTGLNVYLDTTNYLYQYYCDGLVAEQITDYGSVQSKTAYSYLHPAECGTISNIGNLLLFPNPAAHTINVTNPAFISGAYQLEIYDSYGRFIREATNYRGETQTIDVSDLANGVYLLSIQQEENRTTQTFVINR